MSSAVKSGFKTLMNAAEYCIKAGGYDIILKPIQITGGGDGRCVAEFTVTKDHLNPYLGMHGGYAATVIDNFTTYALMTTNCHPGTSINLNINYLKAAKEGDVIVVEANTSKVGSKIAFLECELRRKSDGAMIARGGQTKFIDMPKGKMEVLYE